MAMTAQGMVDKIRAAREALERVPFQTTDPDQARAYADGHLLALCQGIIDEIVANAELVLQHNLTGVGQCGRVIAGIAPNATLSLILDQYIPDPPPPGEGLVTGKVK